jgi:hypothetical protein
MAWDLGKSRAFGVFAASHNSTDRRQCAVQGNPNLTQSVSRQKNFERRWLARAVVQSDEQGWTR